MWEEINSVAFGVMHATSRCQPKIPAQGLEYHLSQGQQGQAIEQYEDGVMRLVKGEDDSPSLP